MFCRQTGRTGSEQNDYQVPGTESLGCSFKGRP